MIIALITAVTALFLYVAVQKRIYKFTRSLYDTHVLASKLDIELGATKKQLNAVTAELAQRKRIKL